MALLKHMDLLKFLFWRSWRTLIPAVAAGIIGGLANTGLLIVINSGLNRGVASRNSIALFVGLCLLAPATKMISETLLTSLGQRALFELRMRLTSQILNLPLRRLEELGGARLLAILVEDLPTIGGLSSVVPTLALSVAIVIGCLSYMVWTAPLLFVITIAIILIGILSYQFPVARANQYLRRVRSNHDKLQKQFQSLISGIKELKLHRQRRQEFIERDLESVAESISEDTKRGFRIYNAAVSWGQLLTFMALGILVFGVRGGGGADRFVIVTYCFCLLYMIAPLQSIMNFIPAFSRASIAWKGITNLEQLLEKEELETIGERAPIQRPAGHISLTGVTYAYEPRNGSNEFALGPIDLEVCPGKLLFITGGNGSGKSTLLKVLIGLYPPQGGKIHLDHKPMTRADLETYRQCFSVVFSDYFLFEKLWGLEASAGFQQTDQYLEKLQLRNKVAIRDGTFSTTNLSAGQRKRLALLTAYVEDRPVYLFDEWAADQDPEFKNVFYLQLLPELKARGKAVVVISHDDRYYNIADQIIKLESGKIVSSKVAGQW